MIIPLKNFFLFGLLFFTIGVCMLCGAVYFSADVLSFISDSIETDGVIEDYIEKSETDSEGRVRKDYYPIIKYSDTAGGTYSFISDVVMNYEVYIFIKAKSSNLKNNLYEVPKVKLRYLTGNPEAARAAGSFSHLWGNVLVTAFLSVVFCLVGGALLRLNPDKKTK